RANGRRGVSRRMAMHRAAVRPVESLPRHHRSQSTLAFNDEANLAGVGSPDRMLCPNCGTQNAPGSRFCGGCAVPLSQVCASCGAANDPGMRFCNQCGAALGADAIARGPIPAHQQSVPIAERRHVSVLFADLVGFTALSESRDAEQTRELLSAYFAAARTVIERYGGTIEKFIGDAVMAVWGAPIATESDAERAVRAGLELVASIPELDGGLRARAGVLSGEAAVTLGAEGQGMVAGDLVNTAS